MSKKLNPSVIGAFVLVAVALLTFSVVYFGASYFNKEDGRFVSIFQSDAKGLDVGAPVLLRGVKIGTVQHVDVFHDNDEAQFLVRVSGSVNDDAILWTEEDIRAMKEEPEKFGELLMEKGLRARLAMQSLVTGKLVVEMGFFPEAEYYYRGEQHEIPTIPTTIEQLADMLESIKFGEIADNLNHIIDGLDTIVGALDVEAVQGELLETLEAIENLAELLAREAGPVSENLNNTLVSVQQLSEHIDDRIEPVMGEINKAAQSADETFRTATRAAKNIDSMVDENAPLRAELLQTLRNLSGAARSLKDVAEYLERHPESLLKGKQ